MLLLEALRLSLIPFLRRVSDIKAASSSPTEALAYAFKVMLALANSAVPNLPVQIFETSLPFDPQVTVSVQTSGV